jgi:hypothetical protein
MIQKQTMNQFVDTLRYLSENKRDYVANGRAFTLTPTGNTHEANLYFGIGDLRQFTPSDYCHSQLASIIGVNQKYYDKCKSDAPELLCQNVNEWMQTDRRRMFRTVGESLRAVVSDRYLCLDSDEVLPALLPTLESSDLKIESAYISPDGSSCYVQAFSPRIQGDVGLNDALQAGVIIKTGDLGNHGFSVRFATKRLVCLNGMVSTRTEDKISIRHLGPAYNGADGRYQIAADTRRALADSITLQTRDFIDSIPARFEDFRRVANAAAQSSPITRVDKAVEVTQGLFGLTDDEKGQILSHLVTDHDLSRWGLSNAITRAAEDSNSYDRAIELEQFGYDLMKLAGPAWEKVAVAA